MITSFLSVPIPYTLFSLIRNTFLNPLWFFFLRRRPGGVSVYLTILHTQLRTDGRGYAERILPEPNWYALIIRYPGHEEALYMEELEPDKTYVYRVYSFERHRSLAGGEVGTLGLGNVLLQE